MLEHAWEQGVPMRWVTGDEVYGDATKVRDAVIEHWRWHVLAVSLDTRVWTERQALDRPRPSGTGRPRTRTRACSRIAAGVATWCKTMLPIA